MATKVPHSLRMDFRDVCDCELNNGERGTVQTYTAFQHVAGEGPRARYGARIVDKHGHEKVYTEGHSDPGAAAKWIKLAVGLVTVAAVWAFVNLLPKFIACLAIALPFWMMR